MSTQKDMRQSHETSQKDMDDGEGEKLLSPSLDTKMKEEEFNLSKKIITAEQATKDCDEDVIFQSDFVWKKDVKEFIKRLQIKVLDFQCIDICDEIKELAGDKLI